MQMLHEDPVSDIDVEKQTLRTNSGKLLKFGSLIIATGCTASRYFITFAYALYPCDHVKFYLKGITSIQTPRVV